MSTSGKICAAVAVAAALSMMIRRPELISTVIALAVTSALVGYLAAWLRDMWHGGE